MDGARVGKVRMAAAQHMYIEFKGVKAHAGMYPWKGRSALDAVEILLHSVNMMREHVEPTARVHYIIKDGGQAVNVVPDRAVVLLTYRDLDRERVNKGVAWDQGHENTGINPVRSDILDRALTEDEPSPVRARSRRIFQQTGEPCATCSEVKKFFKNE
jgi:acetylornithine deacetylase/succinyl-diaminopimelate desuccinylase-like protein